MKNGKYLEYQTHKKIVLGGYSVFIAKYNVRAFFKTKKYFSKIITFKGFKKLSNKSKIITNNFLQKLLNTTKSKNILKYA